MQFTESKNSNNSPQAETEVAASSGMQQKLEDENKALRKEVHRLKIDGMISDAAHQLGFVSLRHAKSFFRDRVVFNANGTGILIKDEDGVSTMFTEYRLSGENDGIATTEVVRIPVSLETAMQQFLDQNPWLRKGHEGKDQTAQSIDDLHTPKEKSDFVKKHGFDAFRRLLQNRRKQS